MSVRIFLNMLPKQIFPSVPIINFWGRFSRCSFSTAQKVENTSKMKIPTKKSETPSITVPTYEEIKNSTELQQKLAEMYKKQAEDPDFQEITRYSMERGLEHLRSQYKK